MTTKRSLWTLLNWLPIRQVHQTSFAEALSQAIASGMEVSEAIAAAALTTRSRRFRYALLDMASYCRQGYSLVWSLSKTGVRTGNQFRASMEVGESRGCLAEELAAFARSRDPHIAARLAASVGRSAEVNRFAAALARLLADQRLTVDVIADAARLASGKGSHFDRVIGDVIEDMRSGESLSKAMQRQPRFFDPFLCKLIADPSGRDDLRKTLARTCGDKVRSDQPVHEQVARRVR